MRFRALLVLGLSFGAASLDCAEPPICVPGCVEDPCAWGWTAPAGPVSVTDDDIIAGMTCESVTESDDEGRPLTMACDGVGRNVEVTWSPAGELRFIRHDSTTRWQPYRQVSELTLEHDDEGRIIRMHEAVLVDGSVRLELSQEWSWEGDVVVEERQRAWRDAENPYEGGKFIQAHAFEPDDERYRDEDGLRSQRIRLWRPDGLLSSDQLLAGPDDVGLDFITYEWADDGRLLRTVQETSPLYEPTGCRQPEPGFFVCTTTYEHDEDGTVIAWSNDEGERTVVSDNCCGNCRQP